MLKQNISVAKTARYILSQEYSDKIKSVWFVLHGYGQLAEDFIRNFDTISNDNSLIVAPEALNRFYWKGFGGRIGATWMTKEDRLNEIKDYINFLNSVHKEVLRKLSSKPSKISVLGFSQGAATACRWVVDSKIKIDNLILWGGTIPPDISNKESGKILEDSNLTIVVGDKDDFIDENMIEHEIKHLTENKLFYRLIRFDGKHEINPEILRQFE
jgi:predicted esterase